MVTEEAEPITNLIGHVENDYLSLWPVFLFIDLLFFLLNFEILIPVGDWLCESLWQSGLSHISYWRAVSSPSCSASDRFPANAPDR